MATPYQIHVTASNTGLLNWKQNEETAAKVSELLQKDLESHHVYFNAEGYHNHIVHHLLTLYGTGATPSSLEKAYNDNYHYQIKALKPHKDVLPELRKGWTESSPYLGNGKYYPDFLKFFQEEIELKGWEAVLQEYLFKGDERSEGLFGRLFAGFVHPLIQLMYGIEWRQPAIIAQALAQAAVHENGTGRILVNVEKAAAASSSSSLPRKTIPELFESARQYNGTLLTIAELDDSNKAYNGVFGPAADEATEFLKQVKVREDELEEKLVEMYHTCAYVAGTTVFHPPHVHKFDFFLIHHLNSSPFFVTLFSFPWLASSAKARILEWKIRFDLVQYIARGCPPLRLDTVKSFKPNTATNSPGGAAVLKPEEFLPRFHRIGDDGHAVKVARSLIIIQELSKKYADRPWIRIADDATWLKLHQLLLEATENQGEIPLWVRSIGFDEAWKDIPKAKTQNVVSRL